MKLNTHRIYLFIGLMTFGSGISGIPSSTANYDIPMLCWSVFNLILGALLISLNISIREETK